MSHTTNVNHPQLIEKELISGLKFPNQDVLTSKEAIKNRTANLERALKLGNLEHNKIKLVFEDTEGIKQVETTIWGITDNRIILKKGTLLPIHCIHIVHV